jgi:lathosterol oxidase
MVVRYFPFQPTLLNEFLCLAVTGLLLYVVLSALSYLVFFVGWRERFNPGYRPDPAADRAAVRLALVAQLGNALLTAPVHHAIARGHSRIYWDVAEHGWTWIFFSIVLCLLFTETCVYWAHRWLHTGLGFRLLHRHHHQWRVTTSWTSMAFHPVDSFLQALPYHVFGFLVPLHGVVYLLMVSGVAVWSVLIHDRVALVTWPIINGARHHALHHRHSRYNYGQYLTLWDRLMGTWQDPHRRPSSNA